MNRALDQLEAFEAGQPAEVVAAGISIQNVVRRYAIWLFLRAWQKAKHHGDYSQELMVNAMVGIAARSLSSLLPEQNTAEAELDELLGSVRALTLKVRDQVCDDLRRIR